MSLGDGLVHLASAETRGSRFHWTGNSKRIQRQLLSQVNFRLPARLRDRAADQTGISF